MKFTANSIPGHYWALIFVVLVIVVDALWWGNLKKLFSKRPETKSRSSRTGGSAPPRKTPFTGQKLVLAREGSMFFDADGDLAHEFYVEQGNKLVRVARGLRRQGMVELPIPAINPSLSVVMQYMKRDGDGEDIAVPQDVKGSRTNTGTTGTRSSTKTASAPLPPRSQPTTPSAQSSKGAKQISSKKAKKGKGKK